jgi:hypothetical protein
LHLKDGEIPVKMVIKWSDFKPLAANVPPPAPAPASVPAKPAAAPPSAGSSASATPATPPK